MTKHSKKVLAPAKFKRRLQAGITRKLQVECKSTHELVRSKLVYIIGTLAPITETITIFTSALFGLLINHLVKKYEPEMSEEDQKAYSWCTVCIEYVKEIFNTFLSSDEFLDEYELILTKFENFVENF